MATVCVNEAAKAVLSWGGLAGQHMQAETVIMAAPAGVHAASAAQSLPFKTQPASQSRQL